MTWYDIINIFWQRRRVALGVGGVTLILALSAVYWQPHSFRGRVVLAVARTAVAENQDYQYDHYYRFQADEKLADTIAQYLASAPGKRSLAESARLGTPLFEWFTRQDLRTTRLGSNLVLIEYTLSDRAESEALGGAMAIVANQFVQNLNEDAREKNWFTILPERLVIESTALSFDRLLLIGLVAGVFAALWTVAGSYFWEGYRTMGRISKNS